MPFVILNGFTQPAVSTNCMNVQFISCSEEVTRLDLQTEDRLSGISMMKPSGPTTTLTVRTRDGGIAPAHISLKSNDTLLRRKNPFCQRSIIKLGRVSYHSENG